MSNFYLSPLRFILKYCFSGFIFSIICTSGSAQNFSTVSWSTAASQKYPVSEAQGRVVNDKLYSFGGFDTKKSTFTPTKRAYVYNPVTDTWSSIADLPYIPNGVDFGGVTHTGITTDSTDIYLAGGYTSDSSGTKQIFGTKQVWKYIISQNAYTRLPDLPIKIAAGQLEYLAGKLHYIGGTNSLRTEDLSNHYVLDLKNVTAGWKTLAPLPNPRNHAGSATFEGKIYFIGGQHGQDSKLTTQKEVDAYNPSTNSWTKLADLPVPSGASGRGHISSGVAVMGNRIMVFGGEIVHQTSINMVSAYSPGLNTWTNLTPLPQNRFSGVAGAINGNLFYTGGSKTNTTFKGIPVIGTILLPPIADAFVRNGAYAGINYGSDTLLAVKGSAVSNYTRISYLKFSLKDVSTIDSATLHIYVSNIDNTAAVSFSLYGIDNDTWTENGITYNNAPAASTSALRTVGVDSKGKYYELDVTNYVKTQANTDKIVSLLIKDPANQNNNLVFTSRENARNSPQLIIAPVNANRSNISFNNRLQNAILKNSDSGLKRVVNKIIVYPNPVSKSFNIRFPDSYKGNYSIKIADESGRIYNACKVRLLAGGSTLNIDITDFSLRAGVYFLKIESDIVNEEIKLIVQP